jgi:hypothetical protein
VFVLVERLPLSFGYPGISWIFRGVWGAAPACLDCSAYLAVLFWTGDLELGRLFLKPRSGLVPGFWDRGQCVIGDWTDQALGARCDVPSKSYWLLRRRGRAFHRALSGISKGRLLGQDLRFLTLTSSPVSPLSIGRSWEILRKRIVRKFKVEIEYFMVRALTVSGLNHLHIVYRGRYLPHQWIRKNWYEIHRAIEIFIEPVRDRGGISRYLTQYLSSQKGIDRMSSSLNWIVRGAVKCWKELCRSWWKLDWSRDVLFAKWDEWIRVFVVAEQLFGNRWYYGKPISAGMLL